MIELILKGLGKRKVRAILNKWIKDQINRCLEHSYEITFDSVIWLNEYTWELYGIDLLDGEPYEIDDLFKFIGNKI